MMNDKDEKDLENLVLRTFKIKKGKVKVETMLMFDRMNKLLKRNNKDDLVQKDK